MLNVWDVGGQQTIRSYWRNYFEQVCTFVTWYLEHKLSQYIKAIREKFSKLAVSNMRLMSTFGAWQTDGLVWVVDSADKRRLEDCKKELHGLLSQEVRGQIFFSNACRLRGCTCFLGAPTQQSILSA